MPSPHELTSLHRLRLSLLLLHHQLLLLTSHPPSLLHWTTGSPSWRLPRLVTHRTLHPLLAYSGPFNFIRCSGVVRKEGGKEGKFCVPIRELGLDCVGVNWSLFVCILIDGDSSTMVLNYGVRVASCANANLVVQLLQLWRTLDWDRGHGACRFW